MTAATASPDFIGAWGGTPRSVDLNGATYYVEFPGPKDATPLVLVHGLGGSHLNWALVGARLAEHRQVYAIDLAGFGLTHPEGRSTSVQANAQLLTRFLEQVVGRPAIVAGNSMGGFITTVVAEARPDLVAGAALLNPALPLPAKRPDRQVAANFLAYLVPKLGEAHLRRGRKKFTPAQQVGRTLGLCVSDLSKVDQRFIESGIALATERRGFAHSDESFLGAARSLLKLNTRVKKSRARMAAIDVPVLLIQGDLDRLVPVKAARIAAALNPQWTYAELAGVGHTPMIEAPVLTTEILEGWLSEHVPS